MHRDIRLLSLGFLFIFTGYNSVQQFVTTYFAQAGLDSTGFLSLLLVYVFLTISNPLSVIFVSKYGSKICMTFGLLIYSLFIASLITNSVLLVYFASCLLGIGASLLWTGQGTYIVKTTDEKSYGANSGFFYTLLSAGSVVGVLILGFLVSKFSFKLPFLIFSIFPIIGLLFIVKLKDLRKESTPDFMRIIVRSIGSTTALRLSVIWFSFSFIFGLIIGIIPIETKRIIGTSYIGLLSSLFFIMPIIFSYLFGKLSDFTGRKKFIVYSYLLGIIGLLLLFIAKEAILLVLGVIFLALNFSIIRPLTFALVGDLSTEKNLEVLTALFLTIGNLGTVSSLLISSITQPKTIYLISIITIIISLVILYPLMKIRFSQIKSKISAEV